MVHPAFSNGRLYLSRIRSTYLIISSIYLRISATYLKIRATKFENYTYLSEETSHPLIENIATINARNYYH